MIEFEKEMTMPSQAVFLAISSVLLLGAAGMMALASNALLRTLKELVEYRKRYLTSDPGFNANPDK